MGARGTVPNRRKRCRMCGRTVYVVQTTTGPRWEVHKDKTRTAVCGNSGHPAN